MSERVEQRGREGKRRGGGVRGGAEEGGGGEGKRNRETGRKKGREGD